MPVSDRYQIDMCRGPLMKQIIIFSVPLVLSGILQMLFNAADLVVVGRYSSYFDLAAVGATTALIHLITTAFIGVSIGANVLVARRLGEQNRKTASRAIHTAVLSSLLIGCFLALLGIGAARHLLTLLATPAEIMDRAVLYMRIYFAGMPLIMLYNFGSAILRAAGDTRRPFLFLAVSGGLNVALNLVFVLFFSWGVAGVAAATVISQALAALLVLLVLIKLRDACRVKLQILRIEWSSLREMLWIGVPAGIQLTCFSFSNLLIQSSVNWFGPEAIAGNMASMTWEGICFVAAASIAQAAISFVSRNYGGRQFARVRRSIRYCAESCALITVMMCGILMLFPEFLLGLFNENREVIAWGMIRFRIALPLLFCCGVEEVFVGSLRGLGYSIGPTVLMIMGICVSRIVWIEVVFCRFRQLDVLLLGYPMSWVLVGVCSAVFMAYALKKLPDHNAFSDN